jgi:hypothetical protein
LKWDQTGTSIKLSLFTGQHALNKWSATYETSQRRNRLVLDL